MPDSEPKPNPFERYTNTELDAQIERVEGLLLNAELEAIGRGEATPDELAAEGRRVQEYFEDFDI
jgi:hypothetical protein